MWQNKYVGIPYKEKGRDLNGIDCWGLLRLVYSEEFNIDLPSFVSEYIENDAASIQELVAQCKEGWELVDAPVPGCLVLFRVLGTESHVGVAVSDTQFLHARQGQDSAVESFDSRAWANRIVGYYKYSEKTAAVLNLVPHPLRTQRFTVNIEPGTTLDTLVPWVAKKYSVPEEIRSRIVIMLNGRVTTPEEWSTTVLKETDRIEYRAVATGGGSRGIFVMVAMIAIAIAAPYVIAPMMGFATPALAMAAMPMTFTMATMAVNLVGSLLINAIAPVRPPEGPTDPGSSENQLMLSGAANQALKYGAIPVILGKVKITPPIGAQNFISYANERDTYLTMLLVWGYGPLDVDYSTMKIGDISISEYTLAKFSGTEENKFITLDRKTAPSATTLSKFNAIYGTDVYQVSKNLTLVCDGNPEGTITNTTYVTDPETGLTERVDTYVYPTPGPYSEAAGNGLTNKIEVAIHFPQGLRKVKAKGNNAGDSSPAPVVINYEVKLAATALAMGSATWQPWKRVTYGADAPKKDAFTVTETYDLTTAQFAQVRVRRETGDNTDDNDSWRYTFDAVFVSATFITNESPAVDPKNCVIAKTALQIKANEQLTGNIEGINAIVQTYAKTWNGSNWVMGATNNPAALFRYVLEHPANPQRVLDADVADKINLAQLQYWFNYCVTKGFTFNRVQAQAKSVLDTLRDICAAGRASPAMIDGKWTVIIDEPKPNIVQHFSPHNSWGFEGSRALPRLPDGLRITYYDESQDYQEAEVIVYAPGQSQQTAELFEAIQLPGVTKTSSVIDHARWHMAQAQLRRESYVLNTDIEYIVANRGDRVKVTHDIPMWGLGSGRIKNRVTSSIFELDEPVPIDSNLTHTIRFRSNAGASNERTLKQSFSITGVQRAANVTTIGLSSIHPLSVGDIVIVNANIAGVNTTLAEITKVTPQGFSYAQTGASITNTTASGTVSLASGYYKKIEVTSTITSTDANAGDLFLFGLNQRESQDLIIMSIEPTSNKSARITLVDYGVTPSYNIFTDYLTLTAEQVFETNITTAPQFLQYAFGLNDIPIVTNIRSDDLVADIISPGTYAYKIKVSFANSPQLPNKVAMVECQYDISSSVNSSNYKNISVPFLANNIDIPNVMVGETYKIRLRYVSSEGRVGVWGNWNIHTVLGKLYNYGEVASVNVKRIGRFLEITPSFGTEAPIPADFKHYEIRILRYQTPLGTLPDIWNSTDSSLLKTTTSSVASFDLKLFPVTDTLNRLSNTGVQYVIACRAVDSVNNYSATTAITAITIVAIPA